LASPLRSLYGPGAEPLFMYMGGACVVAALPGYTLVFDPADFLTDEDIGALRGVVAVFFTSHLEDHFHARTAMKLIDMKGALVIGTEQACAAVGGFAPSTRLEVLRHGKGVKMGERLKAFAIEGVHEAPVNMYYIVYEDRALLFAGDTGYRPLSKLRARLAFLPAGGSKHSSPESAARIAQDVKAETVVAIHCEKGDAERLSQLLQGVEVVAPEPHRPYSLKL